MSDGIENIDDIIQRLKDKKALLGDKPLPLKRPRKGRKARAGLEPYRGSAREKAKHAAYEKLVGSTVSGSWHMLSRAYRYRNKKRLEKGNKPVLFELSLEDWKKLWQAAGMIRHRGIEKAAFHARGNGPDDVRLWRIDDTKPWRLDNCIVVWQAHILANGRKL